MRQDAVRSGKDEKKKLYAVFPIRHDNGAIVQRGFCKIKKKGVTTGAIPLLKPIVEAFSRHAMGGNRYTILIF